MNPAQHSASRRVRPARSTGLYDSFATAGKYTLKGNSQSKWNPQNSARGTVL